MHPHRAIYKTNPFQKSAAQLPSKATASTRLVGRCTAWPILGSAVTANNRESNSYTPRIRQAYFAYDDDNWHNHFSAR